MTLDNRCARCGEISTTTDLCSECGAPLAAAPAAVPVAASSPPSGPVVTPSTGGGSAARVCPECGEKRPSATARYCDTCRYDFVLQKSYGSTEPVVTPSAPPPVADMTPVSSFAPAVVTSSFTALPDTLPALPTAAHDLLASRWEVVAVADPSLCQAGDEQPTDLRERSYPLDFEANLVGRRTDTTHPEIAVPDAGVSKRHARIDKHPDGTLCVIDLGSTNGTKLNGAALESNVSYPLKDGDEILLGIYTRMTVRNR